MLFPEAFQPAGRRMTPSNVSAVVNKAPERDQELACQGDDHRLARAHTAIGNAGPVPPCQCALLLKQQKAPGRVGSRPRRTRALPALASLVPAASRHSRPVEPVKTGVARHRFSVTNGPREHLMDEHIKPVSMPTRRPEPSRLNHGV